MAEAARLFIVTGRVQGVGYRYFAKTSAEKLGLSGYARNLDDGTVEVYAAGAQSKIDDLFAALQRGPRMSDVRGVSWRPAPVEKRSSFDIR